jgi:hypothetical protein
MDHAIVPRHIVLWCNAQLTLADALMRIGPAVFALIVLLSGSVPKVMSIEQVVGRGA